MVTAGDTLTAIARSHNVSLPDLIQAIPSITNPNLSEAPAQNFYALTHVLICARGIKIDGCVT